MPAAAKKSSVQPAERNRALGTTAVKIIATGFGSGLVPVAPGTAGTLVGMPFYLLFSLFPRPLALISIAALSFLAVYAAQEAEKLYKLKDPGVIVIDEIVGFQFAMILLEPTVLRVFLGFVFFRLFDIAKPWPIRHVERKVPGGWGVVADDIVAGLYARVVIGILIVVSGL